MKKVAIAKSWYVLPFFIIGFALTAVYYSYVLREKNDDGKETAASDAVALEMEESMQISPDQSGELMMNMVDVPDTEGASNDRLVVSTYVDNSVHNSNGYDLTDDQINKTSVTKFVDLVRYKSLTFQRKYIDQRFDSQERDDAWATENEGRLSALLRDYFSAANGEDLEVGGPVIHAVECRFDMCRAKLDATFNQRYSTEHRGFVYYQSTIPVRDGEVYRYSWKHDEDAVITDRVYMFFPGRDRSDGR